MNCQTQVVAIVKNRLGLSASLYTIMQALSLTLFEKTPINSILAETDDLTDETQNPKQMNLFDFLMGH